MMQRFTQLLVGSALALCLQPAMALELQSPELANQSRMNKQQEFQGYGCNGSNISPVLEWKDIPSGAKSFALTMHDPDAPKAGGWWHWLVFNIPRDTRTIKAGAGNPASGSMPAQAVQSRTDFGNVGYGGPCPPKGHGTHHYHFTLYALDTEKLPLDENALPVEVDSMIKRHMLSSSRITGLYSR